MLITCPECTLQVSDKAASCPHCGYPMFSEKSPPRKKSIKHLRLPNGFGQISEIKNKNLRNPYRAMVTVGKDEFGKPVCKPLKPQSYFRTYNDAYQALVEYNKNPLDLNTLLTMSELFERWSLEYFKSYNSPSTVRGIKDAWQYCQTIYKMPVVQVRPKHLKYCIESGKYVRRSVIHTPTPKIKGKIKWLFNVLFDYAIEYELTDKNYARQFQLDMSTRKEMKLTKREHIPFDDDEMELLWENVENMSGIDLMLVQCYTGLRPQELGLMEVKNMHFDSGYMIGGMKTEAGKDRIIPIHPRIRKYVKKYLDEAVKLGSKYVFNVSNRSDYFLSYFAYQNMFYRIRDELGLNPDHRPHDGRKHFITKAKEYNVDEYAIKYVVGHKIDDLTERVYTSRKIDWLKSEIEKIK